MSASSNSRFSLRAALALAGLVVFLGWTFLQRDSLVPGSYDSLHRIAGRRVAALERSPVVVVYLDLSSFDLLGLDPGQPWPRALHGRLLRQLTAAGARAAVFDIVFSAPGPNPEADAEFADAMRASQRTILAGESSSKISHQSSDRENWARLSKISPPLDWFATNAAGWGIASHAIDDDYVVRHYLAGFEANSPSLTWAVASLLDLPLTKIPGAMERATGSIIRYYGPPTAIPHVSYAQALAADGVPPDFFRDKIVFIGARPITGMFQTRQDEFRSPFHSWANKELFMPGVEVHATELLNLLNGDALRHATLATEFGVVLVIALLFGGGLVWLRPIPATFAALAGIGITLGLSRLAFEQGILFPWLIVGAVQIPAALGGSVLIHSVEWLRTRRRYEARMREQAALIDKAHDAILVQDLTGKITYANPSAEQLYGWTSPELFSPDQTTADQARATALSEGEWNGELRQQTRKGSIVIVASRWTLIRDEAGQPKALLLINSDITEQKLLEQQFLRTQRLNTIGTLAGGMAHDLNNALAPILMGAQLLRRKAADDESRQWLDMMETSTHRGAEMVRQVLLFARGRGGELERLNFAPVVKELEKLVRETFPNNITVETFLPRDLWAVRGNVTQLHQVLLNLCVNARDAMPDGGKLSFVADNVTLTAAEAAAMAEGKPGEYVSLLVSDTGTGMPPEVQARIFEPFFSTKGEGRGTGIGLATVLRIVKSHDGFLRVESEPGAGTTFEVFLPRASEVLPPPVETSRAEVPQGHGELILVADDEQAIRDLVAAELTAAGYRVMTAANGAEAVALFQQHAADVRLLITDTAMPVMNGAQTIAALRKLQPGLPVILTSGEPTGQPHEGLTELSKPFALDELLATVNRALK